MSKQKKKKSFFILLLFLIINGVLWGYNITVVSEGDAYFIAENWLIYINKIPFENKLGKYQIKNIETIEHYGFPLCTIYHLYPKGHIIIPLFKEAVPVKSFSLFSNFDSTSKGYEAMVLGVLRTSLEYLFEYKQGEIKDIDEGIKSNCSFWRNFLQMDLRNSEIEEIETLYKEENSTSEKRAEGNIKYYILKNDLGIKIKSVKALPLLKTKWGQRGPYCYFTPEHYLVGCVATAIAQIMRYYKWPSQGRGSHSYQWNGWTLSADFSDPYDWDNMPYLTWEYDTQAEKDAVAELCYEVGVSVNMDYGITESSADTIYFSWRAPKYFKYMDIIEEVDRRDYSNVDKWFEVFKKERDLGRPVLASVKVPQGSHACVVDGYLITDPGGGDLNQVHINMGWKGSYDAYYSLDNIMGESDQDIQYATINIIPKGDWDGLIDLDKTSLSFEAVEAESNPASKTFKIKNLGQGILRYLISTNRDWMSFSPERGESSGEWDNITVSVNISGLKKQNYGGTIVINSPNAVNSPQQLKVYLTIKPFPIDPPLNFDGIKRKVRSLFQYEYVNKLIWESNPNNKNKNIVKYRIFQVEGENQTLLEEVDANIHEYLHRKVEKDKKYRYALAAVDYKDREGELSFTEVK